MKKHLTIKIKTDNYELEDFLHQCVNHGVTSTLLDKLLEEGEK